MLTTQINKDNKTTTVWYNGVMTIVPTQTPNDQLAWYRKLMTMSEADRWMVRRRYYSVGEI